MDILKGLIRLSPTAIQLILDFKMTQENKDKKLKDVIAELDQKVQLKINAKIILITLILYNMYLFYMKLYKPAVVSCIITYLVYKLGRKIKLEVKDK